MENSVVEASVQIEEPACVQARAEEKVKVRRVGTVSIGIAMVTFGVMFLLCSVFEIISYETVFALWPVILISYGVEILIFSLFKGKLIYDKGSVFIMILMMFLAAGMAAVDVCLELANYFIVNNW